MNKTIGVIACLLLVFVCFESIALLQAESSIELEQKIIQEPPIQEPPDRRPRPDQRPGLNPLVNPIQRQVARPLVEIDQAYRENADDDLETKLQKEKIRAALMEIGPKRERVRNGQDNIFFLFAAQKRLVAAQLEFHKNPAKIISLLEKNVEIAKQVEDSRKRRAEAFVGRPDDYAQAIYFRADAELKLLRAKKKYKTADGGKSIDK